MGSSSSEATQRYWLMTGEMPSGPFDLSQVHAQLAAGKITWQTLACPVNGTSWLPLLQLPGVGPSPAAPAPPPFPHTQQAIAGQVPREALAIPGGLLAPASDSPIPSAVAPMTGSKMSTLVTLAEQPPVSAVPIAVVVSPPAKDGELKKLGIAAGFLAVAFGVICLYAWMSPGKSQDDRAPKPSPAEVTRYEPPSNIVETNSHQESTNMARAGQFLVSPSEFLGWFTALGIAAVALMSFMLLTLRTHYLVRLSPTITTEKFGGGLAIGGALSIISTLLLTTTSFLLFGTVLELTEADVNPDRARAAGIDQSRYSSARPNAALVHGAARGLGAASKNKAVRVAIVVVLLLLVIGAGYAFTALKLGFWGSFAAMSAGVALPEELTKAFAGVLVLYLVYDTKSLSQIQFQRAVLAAFSIAGLGFGAGEALKYFGSYAKDDADAFWYGVRAVWCVTLHGAWTLIVGAFVMNYLPRDPNSLVNKKADTFFMLLVASMPTAIAHGLYNTCCGQGHVLLWIVGGASIVVAAWIVETSCQEIAEQPKPEQQPL